MQISHEIPICLLDTSVAFNDYSYALVHLFKEYPSYYTFYKKEVERGRKVLLDNSIFELGEAYDSEEFAEWVKELSPTEYIIPDVLEDAKGTKENYLSFVDKYPSLPGDAVAVVQGKTYDEIKDLYLFFATQDRVQKIAISFDYSYYLSEDCLNFAKPLNYAGDGNKWLSYAYGRITLLKRLHDDGVLSIKKKVHLLGCSLPREFSFYRYLDLDEHISSLDTSNPIVAGILGKKYEANGLEEKWSVKLVDYINAELTVDQIQTSWYNVNMFRRIVNG